MKPVRFAHLTDTHFLPAYNPDDPRVIFLPSLTDPKEKLRMCLSRLAAEKLDFILITGDLVHEGDADDYRAFRAFLHENLPDTEIIVSLGNHDRKQAFYEGYLAENRTGDYYGVREIGGLRIITLDSSVPGSENGQLSAEQINWLKAELQQKAPVGTIIHFHHPIRYRGNLDMEVNEEFYNLLQNSDVIGIFCGHTHGGATAMLGGLPEIVGDSTAFGGEFTSETVSFVDRATYNLCALDDGGLRVYQQPFFPYIERRVDWPIEVLLQVMQEKV